MAAASPVPSLSQIRAWDTDHLVDAATTWRATADQWQESFSQVVSHMPAPGGIPWEGPGSEAAQLRASTDAIKVSELADSLRRASTVAGHGADEIHATRQSVLDAVEDAKAPGSPSVRIFRSLADIPTSPPAEVARQAQAETLSTTTPASGAGPATRGPSAACLRNADTGTG